MSQLVVLRIYSPAESPALSRPVVLRHDDPRCRATSQIGGLDPSLVDPGRRIPLWTYWIPTISTRSRQAPRILPAQHPRRISVANARQTRSSQGTFRLSGTNDVPREVRGTGWLRRGPGEGGRGAAKGWPDGRNFMRWGFREI